MNVKRAVEALREVSRQYSVMDLRIEQANNGTIAAEKMQKDFEAANESVRDQLRIFREEVRPA